MKKKKIKLQTNTDEAILFITKEGKQSMCSYAHIRKCLEYGGVKWQAINSDHLQGGTGGREGKGASMLTLMLEYA
jgi:hypothetical protein